MFKLGQMVWCKDKTNCDGSYTRTKYHIPCVVCDIRKQKDGKITVAPFESDEYEATDFVSDDSAMNILNIATA